MVAVVLDVRCLTRQSLRAGLLGAGLVLDLPGIEEREGSSSFKEPRGVVFVGVGLDVLLERRPVVGVAGEEQWIVFVVLHALARFSHAGAKRAAGVGAWPVTTEKVHGRARAPPRQTTRRR